MKKTYLLVILLSAVLFSCKKDKDEQPTNPTPSPYTIVSTDFANAGDTILLNVDTTITQTLSLASGQNITWDYTVLSSERIDSVIFYNPANTPGAQYFTGKSNIAMQPEQGQPLYFYLNKSTDKVEGVGIWANFQGSELHPEFTDRPIMVKFPANYNATLKDSSSLSAIVDLGSNQYGKLEMKQYFDVLYDATGTVNLPNNKTYKCLREKRIEINKTNVFVGMTPNGPWVPVQSNIDTTYSYNYFAKNKKWNVVSIIVNNFTTNTIKEISYIKE